MTIHRVAQNAFARVRLGHLARLHAQHALARTIAKRHAERPYDVVYQLSQVWRGHVQSNRRLPPIP
jgi:hypothetical protein